MSSFSGTDTLPSVEPIIMLFPEDDLPNSFDISTVIVSILPFSFISQFFMGAFLLIILAQVYLRIHHFSPSLNNSIAFPSILHLYLTALLKSFRLLIGSLTIHRIERGRLSADSSSVKKKKPKEACGFPGSGSVLDSFDQQSVL
jgi:hypothetical protein